MTQIDPKGSTMNTRKMMNNTNKREIRETKDKIKEETIQNLNTQQKEKNHILSIL